MFKKILPVGIGLLLIVLITVTVSLVKSTTNRTPSIKNADEVYASYGDYQITNDRLYTMMKNQYGLQELLNEIDKGLFKDEIATFEQAIANTSSDEYKALNAYIIDNIFSVEDLADADEKEAQKAWDNVISSLQVSGILSADEAKNSDYDDTTSTVWNKVRKHFVLSYVRENWAKDAYIKKIKDANDGKLFKETLKESSTDSIEKYFNDNYKGEVIGLFVPFTSQEAAYKMMNKYHINTDSHVITNKGWVKDSYDYYSKKDIEDTDKLSYVEVVEAFIGMYNEVNAYLNDGADIIKGTDYSIVMDSNLTVSRVIKALNTLIDDQNKATDKFGTAVTLPTVAKIATADGLKDATITWNVNSTDYATIENNVITAVFADEGKNDVTVSVTFTVTFNVDGKDYTQESKKDFKFTAHYADGATTPTENMTTIALTEDIDAFSTVKFGEDLLANEDFTFKHSYNDVNAISADLVKYLTVDGTTLKTVSAEDDLHNTYTYQPAKIGNYYYLVLHLEDIKQADLFVKDADGNNVEANGTYNVNDQATYDEIVAKKTEELLSDNAINEMIYENRYNHGLKIYDSYLEAIYEYEYKNFYESTLKVTEYNKYEKTKKTKKDVVATYQNVPGKKKDLTTIKVEDFFNNLEKQYAMSVVAALVENYMIVSDTKYNNIYNPYTDTVLNKTSYKNLMTAEISTLRKNFESDYFTYSYLTYYGFTPNFPAKYGWKKFIKDYFISYNDQELLTNATYGGSIYADAFAKYTDDLYSYEDILAEMNKALEDFFSVTTLNLIIYTDYDYNYADGGENSSKLMMEEKDNWTDTQKAYAKELGELMYKLTVYTNQSTIEAAMNELVTLYNNAGSDYSEPEYLSKVVNGEPTVSVYDYNYFGKFKQQGLFVKFEKAADYDSTSSIMEEYADECRALYDEAKTLGLLDVALDMPLVSKEAVKTDYGYHMIAITKAKAPKALPSEDEIKVARVLNKITEIQTKIDTADKNIADYESKGYDVTSYKAEKAEAESKKATYVAELVALGKEADYTLEAEVKAKIDAWYTPAEKAIEGGTLVSESYLAAFNTTKPNFTNANGSTRFAEFLTMLDAEIKKANEEE